MPTLSLNWPLRPPPMLTPRSFVDNWSKSAPPSSTLARIKPRPVDKYGRMPVPGGALNRTFVISVVTLLSPKSNSRSPAVSSKKFGEKPKSTSKPTTFGFQPMVAPKSRRRSTSSSTSGKSPNDAEPPKLAPTNGETNQLCADAETGNNVNDSKLIIKSLRACIMPPRVCQKRHPPCQRCNLRAPSRKFRATSAVIGSMASPLHRDWPGSIHTYGLATDSTAGITTWSPHRDGPSVRHRDGPTRIGRLALYTLPGHRVRRRGQYHRHRHAR